MANLKDRKDRQVFMTELLPPDQQRLLQLTLITNPTATVPVGPSAPNGVHISHSCFNENSVSFFSGRTGRAGK